MAGPGEEAVVVDEEPRVRARMTVDALIIVPNGEHVEGGGRDEADEQHVRGGEVLELVDQHMAVVGLHRAAQRAIAEQRLQRAEHLLVEVDGPTALELGAVARVRRGQAGHVVERRLDRGRIPEPQADQREAVEVRRDRVGVHAAALRRHEALDDRAHLALVEQLRPAPQRVAEEAVPPRVQRLDARAETGQPRGHLLLRLLVVGEGEHGLALVAAIGQEVAKPFGEHAGLAGAGRRHDAGRARAVADRRQLIGRQAGLRLLRLRLRDEQADLDRLPVHHLDPLEGRGERGAGPPSTHAVRPSGSTTSPGSSGPASVAPSRTALRPHHQMGGPGRSAS